MKTDIIVPLVLTPCNLVCEYEKFRRNKLSTSSGENGGSVDMKTVLAHVDEENTHLTRTIFVNC
jgi:hypothetical protein